MDIAYCDALRFAIDYETKGEKYYRKAGNETKDHLARKTLFILADEEIEHIRKIEKFNDHLLGTSDFDLNKECELSLPERVKTFLSEVKEIAKTESQSELSDISVYDAAMANEKQGYEMYSGVRDSTKDERLKTFFSFLVDEEKSHYKLLSASRKYLADPSYYFEDDGGWIFG